MTPSSQVGSPLFLGIDLSTQQLKAVVVNDQNEIIRREAINFSNELPEFKTVDGVCHNGAVSWTPIGLWLRAMDALLGRLAQSVDLTCIVAVSGSAQMHGTVFWSAESERKLEEMTCENKSGGFFGTMRNSFARDKCPSWMDTSTAEYVDKFDRRIQNLSELGGSIGYLRFSGPQIAKIFEHEPATYQQTSRISLVSSFTASLFIGRVAPIDLTDAGGTNLLDIKQRKWSEECLQIVVEKTEHVNGIRQRLGPLVPASALLGSVSRYLVEAYSFSPQCKVIAFTGDQISSMAGLNVCQGDVVLSLGTSDNALFLSTAFHTLPLGHVFIHPISDTQSYVTLMCYKNGSLTRERIRANLGVDWSGFARLLSESPPGNNGYFGLFYDHDEQEPRVRAGDYRWKPDGEPCKEPFPPHIEARALLEGQILHLRANSPSQIKRVIVTGGASVNQAIQQVIADIFGCPVFMTNDSDSAALGSAKRAKYAYDNQGVPFDDYFANASCDIQAEVVKPRLETAPIYEELLRVYRKREAQLLKNYPH